MRVLQGCLCGWRLCLRCFEASVLSLMAIFLSFGGTHQPHLSL
jgi:hypothetical protein